MRHLTLLALLPLTACTIATSDATADDVPPAHASCRNEALAQFVGQQASEELGRQMLRAAGARTLRWVAKGMMVTMDYRPDRLNIETDAEGRVDRLKCG